MRKHRIALKRASCILQTDLSSLVQGLISSSNIKGKKAHNIKLFPWLMLILAEFSVQHLTAVLCVHMCARMRSLQHGVCARERGWGSWSDYPQNWGFNGLWLSKLWQCSCRKALERLQWNKQLYEWCKTTRRKEHQRDWFRSYWEGFDQWRWIRVLWLTVFNKGSLYLGLCFRVGMHNSLCVCASDCDASRGRLCPIQCLIVKGEFQYL